MLPPLGLKTPPQAGWGEAPSRHIGQFAAEFAQTAEGVKGRFALRKLRP
ncbi:hypothetical protein MKFW12EY_17510 [Methylomonas koyamae]|nr:hypothetical protein MKFW12EY_17510 [Methylomonas koyamae]